MRRYSQFTSSLFSAVINLLTNVELIVKPLSYTLTEIHLYIENKAFILTHILHTDKYKKNTHGSTNQDIAKNKQ